MCNICFYILLKKFLLVEEHVKPYTIPVDGMRKYFALWLPAIFHFDIYSDG